MRRAGTPGAPGRAALAELVALYEPAIRAQLARWRVPGTERDDLYQEFIARLLEDGAIGRADAARGAFRTWLATALHRFAAKALRAATADKRGGCAWHENDEALALLEAPTDGPDRHFDAEWARLLLTRAAAALRGEAEARGKAALFDALEPWLVEDAPRDAYVEIARRFGSNPNAIGVAVHRLRARFRQLVRERVLDTVEDEAALERELALLREALHGAP